MADRRIRPSVVEDQHDPLPRHRLVRPDHAHMRPDDHGQLQRLGRFAARQILPLAGIFPRRVDLQGFFGVEQRQLPLRPHQLPFESRFRRDAQHEAVGQGGRRAGDQGHADGQDRVGHVQHDVFGLADDVSGLLPRLGAGGDSRHGLSRRLGRPSVESAHGLLREHPYVALDGRVRTDHGQQALYRHQLRAEARLHHQRALGESQRFAEHLLLPHLADGDQLQPHVLHRLEPVRRRRRQSVDLLRSQRARL